MISQQSFIGPDKPLINLAAVLEKHPYAKINVRSMVDHCLMEIYEPYHRLDKERQEELTLAVHRIISLDRSRRTHNQKDKEKAKYGI